MRAEGARWSPAIFRRADILWEQVRSGIWAVPLGMMLAGAVVFRLLLWAEQQRPSHELLDALWLHSGSGDDARNLLSTLVSAMITMASLVFSITVVALSLAASQFGSRLVRSYLRDAKSQLTLGTFALTILYCMLALRTVRTGMPPEQVPHLTVSMGMFLSLVCVFAMMLFLHMIAQAIVADEVVRRVAADLEDGIALLPSAPPRVGPTVPIDAGKALPATPLPLMATREGYIEAIRYEEMLARSKMDDAYVELYVMAGDFVARGDRVGSYARADGRDHAFEEDLLQGVLIGPERTPVQDLAYSTRHLIDVGLRALSAAINDDNTAMVVIDRLRGALTRLMRKELPSGRHEDDAGVLRLVGPRHTHQDHIHFALHSLRTSAGSRPVVVTHMITALANLMSHAPDPEMRDFLLAQAELAAQAGMLANAESYEQGGVQRALDRARRTHQALAQG